MLLLIIVLLLLWIVSKDSRRKNQENIDYLHRTVKNVWKKWRNK